jgi:hypothetical protein
MIKKKDTIQDILSEDNRKHLAEPLLNNGIQDMVVIYRKGNDFRVDASNEVIANTVGMLEMAKAWVMSDWLHPKIDEVSDEDEEQ